MNPTGDDVQPIRLEFEVTRDDYAEAWRLLLRTNRSADTWRPMWILGTVAFVVGFFLIAGRRGDAGGCCLLVFGGCVIGWAVHGGHRAMQLAWALYSQMLGVLTWEFDADGARLSTPVSSSAYRWEAFQRLADSKGLFILYHRTGNAVILPKRAFRGEAEQQAFRRLVRARVAPPVGDFPVVSAGSVAPARAEGPRAPGGTGQAGA
jgi:hypothetical protein